MQNESIQCAKCGGEMSAGFILSEGLRGAAAAATWQEGVPKPSFWTGIKHSGTENHPITTLQCTTCGYIESYAK